MNGPRWLAPALTAMLVLPGCQSAPSRRAALASAEPGLAGGATTGTAPSTVVETPPARAVGFVDRHPLFTKPREYYDSSGTNPVVKAAAATVVGIPAGLVGEIRQIVVGAPPAPAY